jgi:hypothetical protein
LKIDELIKASTTLVIYQVMLQIQLLLKNLLQNGGNLQSKLSILNFFGLGENKHPIIKHTIKAAKHLHKHHKKYIF